MGRSEWLTTAITLLSVWLAWDIGQSHAAIICGIVGGSILVVMIFSRREKQHPTPPYQSSQQTANPVITQTANPTTIINVGNQTQLEPQPVHAPRSPRPQPNIKFVEIKPIGIHAGNGKFYESPKGLGDFSVAVACFRNDVIVGQTLLQPQVRAHIIYKDSEGLEIADVPSGVWLNEYEDLASLTVGTKQCVILLLLTNQGTLKRLWKETYTTSHSWMSGPLFRVRDDVITKGIATIEINLLESSSGKGLVQAILGVENSQDGGLPHLALKTISPA